MTVGGKAMGGFFLDMLRMTLSDKEMLLRRKWCVIAPVGAGLVCGVVLWVVQPRVYESSSLIMAAEAATPLPFFGSSVSRRMSAIRDQIVDINNLVQLVDHLNLARELKTEKEYERLILGLRKRITVRSRGPNLFRISYRGVDPGEARAVVSVLDNMFIARHGGAFVVYKRPQLPRRAVAPNLFVLMTAGVFLGACAGIGLVLFLEYRDRRDPQSGS